MKKTARTTTGETKEYSLSLTDFEHAAALSEETIAYSATLVVNGRPVATVKNRGRGGMSMIHAHRPFDETKPVLKEVREHIKGLPEIEAEVNGHSFTYAHTLENTADKLAGRIVWAEENRRSMKTKVFGVLESEDEAVVYSAPDRPAIREKIKEKEDIAFFLNDCLGSASIRL